MTRCLCVISSKNPTSVLSETILGVKTHYPEFDIVVVDSDSTDLSGYITIPSITSVELCKNKNWELGAWRLALTKYHDYDVYMCIQDTLTPISRVPNLRIDQFTNNDFYSFHFDDQTISTFGHLFENERVNVYKDTKFSFISEMDTHKPILGAAHSSFITNKECALLILQLEEPYVSKGLLKTKADSWLSERTVGILADKLQFVRIDITHYFTKSHGGRDY